MRRDRSEQDVYGITNTLHGIRDEAISYGGRKSTWISLSTTTTEGCARKGREREENNTRHQALGRAHNQYDCNDSRAHKLHCSASRITRIQRLYFASHHSRSRSHQNMHHPHVRSKVSGVLIRFQGIVLHHYLGTGIFIRFEEA